MDNIYKTFSVISKAIDHELGIYETMISTEVVDRDGEIVRATGVKIDNFMKNPVILWAHQYTSPPIAKALSIEVAPGVGIKSSFQFPEWGANPQADIVRRLWAGGFLNAASIGFIPLTWKPMNEDGNEWGPKEYTSWELIEYSLVPLPANQEALRLAVKTLTKRGRVLNAKNEQRIRDAAAMLQEVLDTLPEESDETPPRGLKTAIPYRDQGIADEGESWSAPSLTDFSDSPMADLSDAEKRRIAAHYTWSANMPPDAFGDLKLPHHRAQKDGVGVGVGPAVWRGVAAAMGVLMGARGGANIPDGDVAACHGHLSKHYAQWEKEPPELREYNAEEIKTLFPDVDDARAELPNNNDPTNDESDERLAQVLSDYLKTFLEVIT